MLSACGGGSGGGSSETTDSTPFNSVIRQSSSDAAQGKIAAAAIAVPASGSVTQSSNTGIDQFTTDKVSTTVTYANGQINYRVSNSNSNSRHNWVVDSADSGTTTLEAGRGPSGDWNYIELHKSLSDGSLWVDVYTNLGVAGTTDADYLASGLWVYVPDAATSVSDFAFGAFVHGEDLYTQRNLRGLAGQYTYTGDATGVYSVLAEERNYFFDADVTLTANFGTPAILGTIGGYINNFSVADEYIENNPTLILSTEDIGGSEPGFFKGNTGMSYDGDGYTGKWGGQFFDNDGSNPPGSVAGTFGAAANVGGNGEKSLLGVFGAGRDE